MSAKHTHEPWRYVQIGDGDDCFIQADRNKPSDPYDIEVMGDDTNEELYPMKQKMADAARIVACVNAMAGIEDPDMFMKEHEGMRYQYNEARKHRDHFRNERDELLAMLKGVVQILEYEQTDEYLTLKLAKELIAKIESR